MRTRNPIESSEFGCTFDTAGCRLIDVDVWSVVFIDVLFDMQSDCCEGDGFTGPPTYALKSENWIGIVGEGFVLDMLVGRMYWV